MKKTLFISIVGQMHSTSFKMPTFI